MALVAPLNDRPVSAELDPSAPRPDLAPAPAGRLQQVNLAADDRVYTLWMHLSMFASIMIVPGAGAIIPLVMWLTRRTLSSFIDDHGRELANVLITGLILTIVLGWLVVPGWIILGVWYVVTAISVVRGAMAAHRGEYFRYPMTFRLLK
jgi:uncharacterized Tic20 family protein